MNLNWWNLNELTMKCWNWMFIAWPRARLDPLVCDVWGSLGFGQCAVCVLLKLPSVADCLLFQPVQCVALEHWALCPLVSGVVHLLVPLPCLAMLTSVQGMHLETTIVQSGLHIRATDYGFNNIWNVVTNPNTSWRRGSGQYCTSLLKMSKKMQKLEVGLTGKALSKAVFISRLSE